MGSNNIQLVLTGLAVLAALGIAWVWNLNLKMKGQPPEALAISPRRFTEKDCTATYEHIKANPINWVPDLPRKLNRRYVISGGCGGVGGEIVKQLLLRGQSPESIRIVDFRKPDRADMLRGPATQVDFAQADISVLTAVQAAFSRPWPASVAELPLTVFHTAALIDPARRSLWAYSNIERVNVDGTRNLIDAAKTAGATVFVYTSSSSVALRRVQFWGNPFRQWYKGSCQILDESDFDLPLQPHSSYFGNYAHTKAVAERLVCHANEPGFLTGSIRPGNGIYGSSFGDQVVGLVLRAGTAPTWMPNIIQNFVHCGHVSLGHLCLEAALLRDTTPRGSGKGTLPRCAGRPFIISDAGPPPAYSDLYQLLKITVDRPKISIIYLQPAVMLVISYIVEWFDIASHMPLLRFIVPRPSGDISKLQPAVFSASTHTPCTDAAARRSVEEGGIGFKHVCTSLEGISQQIADWNAEHSAQGQI